MKKLMFGLAVLAAGSVMAIESSNIVGYQTKALDNIGYNLITPTFENVDQTVIDLQQIILTNALGDQSENITIFNENGNATVQYFWLNESQGMDPGWYDEGWNLVEGETLGKGKGIYLYTPNEVEVSIQFAGQVDTKTQKIPLGQGYTIAGNSSPIDLDLQSISLSEDALGDQSENITIFNEHGNATVQYFWLNESQGMDPGWYDEGWNLVEGFTVKAGDALMIYQPNNETTMLVLPEIK